MLKRFDPKLLSLIMISLFLLPACDKEVPVEPDPTAAESLSNAVDVSARELNELSLEVAQDSSLPASVKLQSALVIKRSQLAGEKIKALVSGSISTPSEDLVSLTLLKISADHEEDLNAVKREVNALDNEHSKSREAAAAVGSALSDVTHELALFRKFNKKAEESYEPWDDNTLDASVMSNPLYQGSGTSGTNPRYGAHVVGNSNSSGNLTYTLLCPAGSPEMTLELIRASTGERVGSVTGVAELKLDGVYRPREDYYARVASQVSGDFLQVSACKVQYSKSTHIVSEGRPISPRMVAEIESDLSAFAETQSQFKREMSVLEGDAVKTNNGPELSNIRAVVKLNVQIRDVVSQLQKIVSAGSSQESQLKALESELEILNSAIEALSEHARQENPSYENPSKLIKWGHGTAKSIISKISA